MIQEPVVILTNGRYPTHSLPIQKINEAAFIICCDGAVNQLSDEGLEPDIIIGDLDSIDEKLKSKYKDIIVHITEQNENDLRKAIAWAEHAKINKITILGATGRRDDHSLGNIFSLLQFPTPANCTLITDYGTFSTVENKKKIKSYKGQQISIFSLDAEIKITSTNLKYNLNNTMLNTLYIGTLNESLEEYFTLALSHGKILVYQVSA